MTPLKCVSSVQDVGITFDDTTLFKRRIENVNLATVKKINFTKRFSKDVRTGKLLRLLYYSYVNPIFSFGWVIWKPHLSSQVHLLEKFLHQLVI